MTKAPASAPTRTSAHERSIGHGISDILRTLTLVLGKKAVAAIVGKDVRTVDRWLAGKHTSISMDNEKVLRDTFQIYEILADGDSDQTVRAWFLGMNPALNDRAPIEVLIDGHARSVVAAARAFADS